MSIRIASPHCVIEQITSLGALEDLRLEWVDLWRRTPLATPFQSPHWLIPWVRHFQPKQLWTLALRVEGRLVALAPLFIHREAGSARKLLLLGAGNTDYLDLLVAPDYQHSALAAILNHLVRCHDQWDVCELNQLRSQSPLLNTCLPAELPMVGSAEGVCPVLKGDMTRRLLHDRVPQPQRRKLDYYRRRAERTGSIAYESANRENFAELFAALLRLHEARWSQRAMPGVLGESSVREFHREAAAEMLEAGWLRLVVLRLEQRIIAACYGLSDSHRTYYYVGGFDPTFRQLSPGMLIVGHALESAGQEGCEAFDFLRGSEPYKYAWGAEDELTFTLRL